MVKLLFRIVEVNGANVNQENHKQVVARIKSVESETRLLGMMMTLVLQITNYCNFSFAITRIYLTQVSFGLVFISVISG